MVLEEDGSVREDLVLKTCTYRSGGIVAAMAGAASTSEERDGTMDPLSPDGLLLRASLTHGDSPCHPPKVKAEHHDDDVSNIVTAPLGHAEPMMTSRKSASTEAASALPPSCFNHDNAADTACTICLEPLCDGDRIGMLKCDHCFHVNCLKVWIRRKNSCPLCQAPDIAVPRHRTRRRGFGRGGVSEDGGEEASRDEEGLRRDPPSEVRRVGAGGGAGATRRRSGNLPLHDFAGTGGDEQATRRRRQRPARWWQYYMFGSGR